MAHFIGFLQGNRGEASRLGSKKSGIEAIARGWNIGGKIWVSHNETTGQDELTLYIDKGSTNTTSKRVLTITENELDGYMAR